MRSPHDVTRQFEEVADAADAAATPVGVVKALSRKPLLFRFAGVWVCGNTERSAHADTFREAYRLWAAK